MRRTANARSHELQVEGNIFDGSMMKFYADVDHAAVHCRVTEGECSFIPQSARFQIYHSCLSQSIDHGDEGLKKHDEHPTPQSAMSDLLATV